MPHTRGPTLASGGTSLFPTNAPEGPWQPAPLRGRCPRDGTQPLWLPKAIFLMRTVTCIGSSCASARTYWYRSSGRSLLF